MNVDWRVGQPPSLTVQVNDTGIGFSPDALERVFKPFEQADSGLSREHGGLGIGLSICDKLIGLMKGQISIESIQYKGSRIDLSIPVSKADHVTGRNKQTA